MTTTPETPEQWARRILQTTVTAPSYNTLNAGLNLRDELAAVKRLADRAAELEMENKEIRKRLVATMDVFDKHFYEGPR